MYAYRFLSSCGRLVVSAAREVFTGLRSFGAALIGLPLPPEAFPAPGTPAPTRARDTAAPDPTARPAGPAADACPAGPPGATRPAGPPVGAPPTGHPERLIPHVPPTPVERRLWSQLR
ncbi:DUF6059 family protein [Micromonospora cathayae]|uniref:Uncharacterized protein n=1 Tax=Micromonospora cathayae TaxID=3028804 RepID=A0ABY7ZH91_9ACTN|nr:DUF6059 family protein [Micromonospora sp. HUAS 3]WDZ82187.1 hypothetical protein PVK37_16900 [Micromonospora sp. HUAS 3]